MNENCNHTFVHLTVTQTDLSLYKPGWQYGKEKIVGKHRIIKVSGADPGGFTNISYHNLEEVISEYKITAKRNMESSESISLMIEGMNEFDKGGEVVVYIGRSTISRADMENFRVIIKDKEGNEIARQGFNSELPSSTKEDHLWRNTGLISIGTNIELPFDVIVVDLVDSKNAQKHFRILN